MEFLSYREALFMVRRVDTTKVLQIFVSELSYIKDNNARYSQRGKGMGKELIHSNL